MKFNDNAFSKAQGKHKRTEQKKTLWQTVRKINNTNNNKKKESTLEWRKVHFSKDLKWLSLSK